MNTTIPKEIADLLRKTYRAARINPDRRHLQRVLLASHVADAMFERNFSPVAVEAVNQAIDLCVTLGAGEEAVIGVLRALGFTVE